MLAVIPSNDCDTASPPSIDLDADQKAERFRILMGADVMTVAGEYARHGALEERELAGPRMRAVAATIFGNSLEWFDFAAYAFFATTISGHFFPPGNDLVQLMNTFAAFGLGFIARPLGALFFGRLGDDRGRRLALLISMPLMGLGTLMIGLAPSYASIGIGAPLILLGARLLQGFSAGGEVGNAMAFLSEWAPSDRRGLYTGLQQCSALLGTLAGSGCAAIVNGLLSADALSSWGWRLPFLVGGLVVAPLGWLLRKAVDETPVFERPVGADPKAGAHPSPWTLGAKTVALCAAWVVSFYVYLIYLPSYLAKLTGASATTALWANTAGLATMMVTIPLAGMLSDRIGRRPPLLVATVLAIVLPFPIFSYLVGGPSSFGTFAVLIGAGALCGLFAGIIPATMSEMFPTAVRTTGVSVSFGLATAVFGGFAPFISTWLISLTGSKIAPAGYLLVAGFLSLATLLSVKETAYDDL